jgi:hypothetical protein
MVENAHDMVENAEMRKCGGGLMEWVVYVAVGMAVGLSLGYVIGIRRGSVIVGALLSGIIDGIKKDGDPGGV